jgi:phosphocarrier protein HPr
VREPAEMKIDKKLTIINERGLHARAAAKFTETIAPFSCTISVSKDNETVSGHSIMGLMMLAASKDTVIQIDATGTDAEKAIQKIIELVDNKFYEE